MKIDFKTILILILIFIIGILIGINFNKKDDGNSSAFSPRENLIPTDNGKLAKEYNSKELIGFIKKNSAKIQTCYVAYLEKKPAIKEGNLQILIKVEEDGHISSIKVTNNALKDENLTNCVIEKFENRYLAPPPYGINRFLSHSLSFKSAESAKKEQAERELKRKSLPLIVPIK